NLPKMARRTQLVNTPTNYSRMLTIKYWTDMAYFIWNLIVMFFMTLMPSGIIPTSQQGDRYGSTQYKLGGRGTMGNKAKFGSIRRQGDGPKAPP
ncbi:SelK/SelG family selenoprotein, partial [Salmonella sp. s51228]|uniref:SelK/SelG family selenoprotein n=1 Tax=Salmonella sp. s51228 TaxID=3159652 RepID=UPI0039803A00